MCDISQRLFEFTKVVLRSSFSLNQRFYIAIVLEASSDSLLSSKLLEGKKLVMYLSLAKAVKLF